MTELAKRGIAVIVLLATGGCEEPPAWAPIDNSHRYDEADGGMRFEPAPPEIPWLEDGEPPVEAPRIPWLEAGEPTIAPPAVPMMVDGACTGGWRRVEREGGIVFCDPWPEAGWQTCGDDAMHLPGTPGCAPIGSACAADGWPATLPAGATVVYVDDDAATAGDGTSRGSAFRALEDGLAAAAPGDVVSLAEGTYEGPFVLPPSVSLVGACVSGTALTSATMSDDVPVLAIAADGSISNLRVVDAPRPGVEVSAGTLALVDVLVARVRGVGVHVEGIAASLSASDLAVRDNTDALPAPTAAIRVAGGAEATLGRLEVSGAADLGVHVVGAGSRATVTDAALVGARRANATSVLGGGALASEGGALTVERAGFVENTFGGGAMADGSLAARSVHVLRSGVGIPPDATPVDEPIAALGALAAQLVVEGAVLDDSYVAALVAAPGGDVRATDVLVLGTQADPSGLGGVGSSSLGADAVMEMERAVFAGNAVAIHGDGCRRLTAIDVRVRGAGAGIGSLNGGELVLERVSVVDVDGYGAGAAFGSVLRASDLVVRDVRPHARGPGNGIFGIENAHELSRVLVERATGYGFFLMAAAQIEDAVVRDTGPLDELGRQPGLGLFHTVRGVVEARRLLFEGNPGGVGSTVDADTRLDDVRIRGDAGPQHVGLSVGYRASLQGRRVIVEGGLRGATVWTAGTILTLEDALIADAEWVGLSYQLGTRGELRRTLVRGTAGFATAFQAATVGMYDVRIEDTGPFPDVRGGGVAVFGDFGAEITAERVAIDASRVAGVLLESGAQADLEDLTVTATEVEECECNAPRGGFGLAVGMRPSDPVHRSQISARRFRVAESAVCGLVIGHGGEMDLSEGEVTGAPIGACVQRAVFDQRRLRGDVRYTDVGAPLRASNYSLPAVTPPDDPMEAP